jgi:hypothetical protein
MTGKRIGYTSVPYDSIGAFSVETAGSFDTDSQLNVHAKGIGRLSMDYAKGVDVISIFRHLSGAVLSNCKGGSNTTTTNTTMTNTTGMGTGNAGGGTGIMGILDVLGSDYAQVDARSVEMRLKSDPNTNILIENEGIEMAFKCGRDLLLFTSHRLLGIDVRGVSGKKGERDFLPFFTTRPISSYEVLIRVCLIFING